MLMRAEAATSSMGLATTPAVIQRTSISETAARSERLFWPRHHFGSPSSMR